jgi:hypothetical protein
VKCRKNGEFCLGEEERVKEVSPRAKKGSGDVLKVFLYSFMEVQ